MNRERELAQWVVSLWWGQRGDIYVRLYRDAPLWVQNSVSERFGKRIALLRSEQLRPQVG
jgi:hypothetical protein